MEYHVPVLLSESMEGLAIRPDGVYVDATFGGGGHSRAILQHLREGGRLIGFDQDADASNNVPDDSRFTFVGENFRYLKNYLRLHGVRRIDGLLADLGVSSHQFDEAGRGFTFREDGPLDLRMDQRQEITAADLVNTLNESDLASLLHLYGELPNAGAMAKAIVRTREQEAIAGTLALRNAVQRLLPRGAENKYLAMLFQALRIEVNGEMEALKALLNQATEMLNPGGRLVVISYHSLEDRLVKNMMKTGNVEGNLKKDFYGNPLVPLRPVNHKVTIPGPEEQKCNNRSRSAKLRVAEKLPEKPQ